jgi:hypothetical protein
MSGSSRDQSGRFSYAARWRKAAVLLQALRNVHLGKAAGSSCVHRCDNSINVTVHLQLDIEPSFKHQRVVDCILQILFGAQVPFRRQDRLMPQQKLNLFQLPPFERQSFAAVRRRSCGASSPIPICCAYSRTSCHTARSVKAFLPTRPFADTRRKIGPFSIPAVSSHPSIACFTHSGTATDRTLLPFPMKSRKTQRPSRMARCPQFMRDNSPRRNAHVSPLVAALALVG